MEKKQLESMLSSPPSMQPEILLFWLTVSGIRNDLVKHL